MPSLLSEFSVLLDEGVEFVPVAGAAVEVRDYTDPDNVARLLPDLAADGDGLVAASSLNVPAGSKIRLSWKDADSGRCGMAEAVTGAGYTMDLISRRSGGQNIVSRPQARPNWYREATAPAARAQVWKRNADQPPAAAVMVGVFELGQEYKLDYNPATDRNVILGVNPLSADGTSCFSRPEDFIWAELPVSRPTVPVLGNDGHVPTVTLAPTIAKSDAAPNDWIVITQAPDANAATVKYGEIKVQKADDAAVFEVWGLSVSKQERIPQKAFDCEVSYRWKNQATEDVYGDPDNPQPGWSVWSPTADAPGSGNEAANAALPAAGEAVTGVEFDPAGSMEGIERGLVQS